MYNNPEQFKSTIDEEFYGTVDYIVSKYKMAEFMTFNNDEKTIIIREYSEKCLNEKEQNSQQQSIKTGGLKL